MRKELDDLLCEKYPYVFKDRHAGPQKSCMSWGFSCGDGWFNIINQLCCSITHHIKQVREQRTNDLLYNRRMRNAIKYNDVTMLYNPEYKNYDWHKQKCQEEFVLQSFKTVSSRVERVVAVQVKEKFGSLRFYYRGGDDYVSGLVAMAEAMSAVTCDVCGSPTDTECWKGAARCKLHSISEELD